MCDRKKQMILVSDADPVTKVEKLIEPTPYAFGNLREILIGYLLLQCLHLLPRKATAPSRQIIPTDTLRWQIRDL